MSWIESNRAKHAAALATVLSSVFAAWLYHYWHWIGSGAPITISGDALQVLAMAKIYASGEAVPFAPKLIDALNAPFRAYWSEFPTNDAIHFTNGLFVSVFGFADGTLLTLFLNHMAAGAAFYGVGTALRYRTVFVIAGAILFAVAPFGFHRGLGHLTIAIYWHVPLILLSVVWLAAPERTCLSPRAGLLVALLASFVTGALLAYYTYALIWFVSIIAASALVYRHYARLAAAVAMILAAAAGFVLQYLDTFIAMARFGANPDAVQRGLRGALRYALYLPDMLFPTRHHWDRFVHAAENHYFSRIPSQFQSEIFSTYIGVVAIAGLVWLLVADTLKIPARRPDAVSPWYWLAVGTIAIAIAGGVSYLLAAAGFELFRATNRFSIILTAISLLFLCEQASRLKRPGWALLPVAAIVAFAMWDQVPPRSGPDTVAAVERTFETDRAIAGELEDRLPSGAMIFQLPVMPYPEVPPINDMQDYEHLRLFLHTTSLRYSYGQVRGRADADWQRDVEALPGPDMVSALEKYGFAALMINRRAYEDKGTELAESFGALGLPVLVDRGDFVVFGLDPSSTPVLPPRQGPHSIGASIP